MRVKLTQEFVNSAKPADDLEREIFWDTGTESFGLMCTAGGHKSYVVQYRADGISRRYTIKAKKSLKLARKEAKALLGQIAKGADPVGDKHRAKREAANTLQSIAEIYLQREEKRKELRSIGERRRILEVYVFPTLGGRRIETITRSQVTALLDDIEDENGPSMRDHCSPSCGR